jgi:pimeloyl-ACP methyl ester carboxylesterase
MAETRVNGVRLYHEEHSSGEPILCIHGTSSSALLWRPAAVEALATLGRVILYDRRGCTRSERPEPYRTSVAEHADDAGALLESLDARPAVLIGRSYGGGVAVGTAIRHPERVRALVLLEPADVVLDDAAPPAWEERLAREVEEAAAQDVASVAERFLRSVLGDTAWEGFPEELRSMFTGNSPAIVAEVRGEPLRVTSEELSAITVPTLIVTAETSGPRFGPLGDRLAAAIPEARVARVGGGHLIDPGEPSILDFVTEVLGRSPAIAPEAAGS